MRRILASLALCALAVVPATASEAISPYEQAVVESADRQQSDRQLVDGFLAREDVATAAGQAGIDLDEARAATERMPAGQLHRVANELRANGIEAPGSTKIVLSTTTVIIILLVLILIAVA